MISKSMLRSLAVWMWATGGALSLPSVALGQTSAERANARAAAESGAAAFDQGRYSDALDLFTRAEKLFHAPPHLLYIARANVKLGRLVDAHEAYVNVVREELAANAPQVFRSARADAQTELAQLKPRIPKVSILVHSGAGGNANVADLRVTMDGKPVQSALIGIPQLVDPGQHEFTAVAPGMTEAKVSLTLAEGVEEKAVLELKPAAGTASATAATAATNTTTAVAPAERPAETPSSGGMSGQRVGAYAAFGVGAVGLGLGTVFFFTAKKAQDDSDTAVRACRPNCTQADRARVDKLDSTAGSRRTVSTVGFIAGGVGVVTGVTLLLLDRKPAPAQAAVVRPWIGVGTVGVDGRF
jgi:hypothetical protein